MRQPHLSPGTLRRSAVTLFRGAAYCSSLWLHLRWPVRLDEARLALRDRLDNREAGLLAVARHAIYPSPRSPYRRLLRHAGCEYGDLERLVRQDGIDGALATLFRVGVYLASDELKGKRPVVRGSLRFAASLADVRSPRHVVPAPLPTRRAAFRPLVPVHLAMFQDLAVSASLSLEARGGLAWSHALWGWPSDGGIIQLLRLWGPDYRPVRWFSKPMIRTFTREQRLTARLLWQVSSLAGCPGPRIEDASLANPRPILDWLRDELRAGRTPHVTGNTSALAGLAQLAAETGADLSGAQMTTVAEPSTTARLALIQNTGAEPLPCYGAKETGMLAYGCLAPSHPDDMHVYHDTYAVIQPPPSPSEASFPPDALLCSSLRAGWPLVALNLSIGDRGLLEQRACGCPLERLGWTTHVAQVRGFDKLKLAGAPVPATSVVDFLEHALPARFGGGPLDYQLLEDDAPIVDGHKLIRLLIHPNVGPVDELEAAAEVIALARRNDWHIDQVWGEKRWVRVERRPPIESSGGKLYHIHRAT